jgi:hypothetical protein
LTVKPYTAADFYTEIGMFLLGVAGAVLVGTQTNWQVGLGVYLLATFARTRP